MHILKQKAPRFDRARSAAANQGFYRRIEAADQSEAR
jgi:hypothetical protein